MNSNKRPILGNIWTGPGEAHHKLAFGDHVLVTRLGKINIVHTDNPSHETSQKRIEEVIHEEIDHRREVFPLNRYGVVLTHWRWCGDPFEDDCPLCQEMKKHSYDVVYTGEEY